MSFDRYIKQKRRKTPDFYCKIKKLKIVATHRHYHSSNNLSVSSFSIYFKHKHTYLNVVCGGNLHCWHHLEDSRLQTCQSLKRGLSINCLCLKKRLRCLNPFIFYVVLYPTVSLAVSFCFIISKVASLGLSNVDTPFPCSIDTRHYGNICAGEDLVYIVQLSLQGKSHYGKPYNRTHAQILRCLTFKCIFIIFIYPLYAGNKKINILWT